MSREKSDFLYLKRGPDVLSNNPLREKAMESMDSIKNLLTKVENTLDKQK